MKNLRELFEELQNAIKKYDEARKGNKPVEEVRALAEKVKECRELYDIQKQVEDSALEEIRTNGEKAKQPTPNGLRSLEEMTDDELEAEYTGAFLRAVRNPKMVTERDERLHNMVREKREAMTPQGTTTHFKSSVEADGGLVLPKDLMTEIKEYKRTLDFDLSTLITVEKTSFLSGERVFEKLSEMKPFTAISEWDKIGEVDSPQFEKKAYSMKDYAGILPVPRKLLQDTDQNLKAYLVKFIAKKSLLTRNLEILKVMQALNKHSKDIKVVDTIKEILDVTLDPLFVANGKILTNQDGYHWLDTLKDADGRYLMKDDVTQATGKTFLGLPIIWLSNKQLKTKSNKVPLFIGDFKEVAVLFDRGEYEVLGTDIGGNAFHRNTHDIRVIDRFDVLKWDEEAVVYAEINTTKKSGKPATDTEGA